MIDMKKIDVLIDYRLVQVGSGSGFLNSDSPDPTENGPDPQPCS